jgi:hypothetical protein
MLSRKTPSSSPVAQDPTPPPPPSRRKDRLLAPPSIKHQPHLTNYDIALRSHPPLNSNLQQAPYIPPITATAEGEILGAYGWPRRSLQPLRALGVQIKAPQHAKRSGKRNEECPVALFSEGPNTARVWYSHVAQEIASQGSVVVMMGHPYDTDIVEFPNGDVVSAESCDL